MTVKGENKYEVNFHFKESSRYFSEVEWPGKGRLPAVSVLIIEDGLEAVSEETI